MDRQIGSCCPRTAEFSTRPPKAGRLLTRQHDYVVRTHDLDFGAILAATHGEKPSVVQIRAENVSPDAIGPQVMIALRQMAVELETGALVTLDPKRTRLRVLPLHSR